jgi:hypothetical protein
MRCAYATIIQEIGIHMITSISNLASTVYRFLKPVVATIQVMGLTVEPMRFLKRYILIQPLLYVVIELLPRCLLLYSTPRSYKIVPSVINAREAKQILP